MKNQLVKFLIIGFLWFGLVGCEETGHFDLLITDVEIFDGTGVVSKIGNVAINGDQIAKISTSSKFTADEVVDGEGLSLSPGFIDVHAHLEPLPIIMDAQNFLHMGVTTALGGPDGSSPINLRRYLDSLENMKTGINVAYLIGHNSTRSEVMGLDSRAPSDTELSEMAKIVESGMRDGAFGMSTGLKYLPGAFAKTDEIVRVAKAASQLGGIYTSHLREEGLGLLEGVNEAIQIAEEADIRVVLTHHKAIGQPMWGKSEITLGLVDSARNAGLDVMIDQYPYTASYTSIAVLIPPWAMAGGRYTKFAERCENPVLRDSIKRGITFNIINDRGGGDLKRIQLARFNWKPHLEGKTLYDWAIEEDMEPTPENGAELVIRAQLHRGANAIYHAMSEEDVERIMSHPMTMVASDGRITEFEKGFPHPRVHGTYPRVLGHYARDKGIISMEEAIRKMTSLPASCLGLKDRGLVQEGYKADLVLFDKNQIIDQATFEKPHQYPLGIKRVFVNGKTALSEDGLSETRHGHILRGPAYQN